ncbi:hypothetical protein MLPM_0573 [Mycobacterium lepromatosis]|uniref:Uncharacterized protein n=1 Tax=Mycobacterium lepromatosis TaxID=480418 RepID=A0A0F4ERM7_9MYCO|nr:hypothetical protein MLPM_0573 [Mycobacterium lepromatosis]
MGLFPREALEVPRTDHWPGLISYLAELGRSVSSALRVASAALWFSVPVGWVWR